MEERTRGKKKRMVAVDERERSKREGGRERKREKLVLGSVGK